MLLFAKLFKEKVRKEGVEQGINKKRQNWIAWNKRRIEAEEKGQEFNEPPPIHIIDDDEDD